METTDEETTDEESSTDERIHPRDEIERYIVSEHYMMSDRYRSPNARRQPLQRKRMVPRNSSGVIDGRTGQSEGTYHVVLNRYVLSDDIPHQDSSATFNPSDEVERFTLDMQSSTLTHVTFGIQ